MFGEHHTGRRRAEDEGAAFFANADRARNLLEIDDSAGRQPAGAKLHQQIGAAAQWTGRSTAGGERARSFFGACRRQILELRQASSCGFKPPFNSNSFTGPEARRNLVTPTGYREIAAEPARDGPKDAAAAPPRLQPPVRSSPLCRSSAFTLGSRPRKLR